MIMKNGILNFLKEYATLLPLVFALVPFIVAYMMTFAFTYGNSQDAAFIIGHVGIVEIWLQGLAYSLASLVQFMVVLPMLFLARNIRKHVFIFGLTFLLLLCLALFTVHIPSLVIMVLALIALPIVIKVAKSKAVRRIEAEGVPKIEAEQKVKARIMTSLQDDLFKKLFSVATLLLVIPVVVAVMSYPYSPRSEVSLKDGTAYSGYLLSRNSEESLFYDTESRSLRIINSANIEAVDLCSSMLKSPLNQSVVGFLTERELIPRC